MQPSALAPGDVITGLRPLAIVLQTISYWSAVEIFITLYDNPYSAGFCSARDLIEKKEIRKLYI